MKDEVMTNSFFAFGVKMHKVAYQFNNTQKPWVFYWENIKIQKHQIFDICLKTLSIPCSETKPLQNIHF